jgi:hypothetical protein
VKGPSTITVTVEEHRRDVTDPTLRWKPVPNSSVTLSSLTIATGYAWTGEVTLPADLGARPMRVVIREYESFLVTDREARDRDRRLVYLDTIELGGGPIDA